MAAHSRARPLLPIPIAMQRAAYITLFLIPFGIQLVASRAFPDLAVLVSPNALFGIVLVAASLCAVTAGLVIHRGWRTDAAELGWLGLFYLSVSLLPLVHGLTTPGVFYGPNKATMSAVFWAVPIGAVAASPSLLCSIPRFRFGVLARCWRGWVAGWVIALVALSATMLAAPNLIGMPNPFSAIGIAVIGAGVTASLAFGWRHVELAEIANSRAPLAISAGYSLVAAAGAVFFGAIPYSGAFWMAHVLDICGVFAATIGAYLVYKRSDSIKQVLVPIVAVEPVAALEVGMAPEVLEFVADLERKDQITRDHVVRTAELAVQVAAELRLPPHEQRRAGLVGVLHDIGKLRIPDEILNKPGKLDNEEFAVMRSHADEGSRIVAGCAPLADLAPAVRAHHERIDGRGYPDGLAGADIPLVARIVSVCDGFDAMAHTRQYREGMDLTKVIAILREHAGAQWDSEIVDAVIRIVTSRGEWESRLLTTERLDHCDCVPEGFDTDAGDISVLA